MTRFVLVAPARSGSTALRMALNRHPEITCHGEIFGERRVLSLHPATRTGLPADPAELFTFRSGHTLEFLEKAFKTRLPVSGFKILYDQLVQVYAADACDYLVTNTDIKVIFLWRQDLCRRFVSEYIHRRRSLGPKAGVADRSTLSADEMWQDARNHLAMRPRLMRMFENHDTIEVLYEEIVATQRIPQLNDFLAVGAPPVELAPRRSEPRDSEISVENEAELRKEYERRLAGSSPA